MFGCNDRKLVSLIAVILSCGFDFRRDEKRRREKYTIQTGHQNRSFRSHRVRHVIKSRFVGDYLQLNTQLAIQ